MEDVVLNNVYHWQMMQVSWWRWSYWSFTKWFLQIVWLLESRFTDSKTKCLRSKQSHFILYVLTLKIENGRVFVYELSGCWFESRSIHLTFRYHACFEQRVSWHSCNYRVQIHSKRVCDIIKNIVPEESILIPLLFKKQKCDMVYESRDLDIARYVDNNTPYISALKSWTIY